MALLSVVTHHLHNARVLGQLRPGDRIEFPRGLYSHWGIYLGDGEVAHLTGNDNNSAMAGQSMFAFSSVGLTSGNAEVCVDDFWTVVKDSEARINNDRDSENSPLPRPEIVRRARQRKGETGFDLFTSNCEHFVNWCRYGDATSDQADNLQLGLEVANFAVNFGLEMYKLYQDSKKEEEEKKRREARSRNFFDY